MLYNDQHFTWIELKYVREQWAHKKDRNRFKLGDKGRFKTFAEHVEDAELPRRHAVGVDSKNKRLPNNGKVVYLALCYDGRILMDVYTGPERQPQ